MEEVKLTIKAIAAVKGMSIQELAEAAGINPQHLYSVSCGRATMTADDIVKIHNLTEYPVNNIQYTY